MNELKIQAFALKEVDAKWHYQGVPFTGVSFAEEGETIVPKDMVNGVVVGDYVSEYVTEVEKSRIRATPGSQSPVKYGDEILTGITYSFEKEFLDVEHFYVDGIVELTVEWYPTGHIKSYQRYVDQLGGNFEFYDNGKMKRVHVAKAHDAQLRMDISEDSRLESLSLSDLFFAIHTTLVDSLPFLIPTNVAEIARFPADDDISLWGPGLLDVVDLMLKNRSFDNTTVIRAIEVNFTESQTKQFGALPKLKELQIEDTQGILAAVLRQIKTQRPDIEVTYEFVLD